jgi:hypothetical protein
MEDILIGDIYFAMERKANKQTRTKYVIALD